MNLANLEKKRNIRQLLDKQGVSEKLTKLSVDFFANNYHARVNIAPGVSDNALDEGNISNGVA